MTMTTFFLSETDKKKVLKYVLFNHDLDFLDFDVLNIVSNVANVGRHD